MRLRLMIVADDAMSASAVRRGLRATPAFAVLESYADGRGPCGDVAATHRPDVVVVDELRSRDTTLARLGELRAALPDAKIVLLPLRMESGWLHDAAAAGADAALARTLRLDELGPVLREVVLGNVFHAFDTPPARMRPAVPTGLPELTDRELEILRLVAAGASNGCIAAQLWITEQTVKFHLSNVYRKLGVSNRTAASHHAHVHGLLEATPLAGVAA